MRKGKSNNHTSKKWHYRGSRGGMKVQKRKVKIVQSMWKDLGLNIRCNFFSINCYFYDL